MNYLCSKMSFRFRIRLAIYTDNLGFKYTDRGEKASEIGHRFSQIDTDGIFKVERFTVHARPGATTVIKEINPLLLLKYMPWGKLLEIRSGPGVPCYSRMLNALCAMRHAISLGSNLLKSDKAERACSFHRRAAENGVFSKFETDIDTDQKEKAGPFDPAWNKIFNILLNTALYDLSKNILLCR